MCTVWEAFCVCQWDNQGTSKCNIITYRNRQTDMKMLLMSLSKPFCKSIFFLNVKLLLSKNCESEPVLWFLSDGVNVAAVERLQVRRGIEKWSFKQPLTAASPSEAQKRWTKHFSCYQSIAAALTLLMWNSRRLMYRSMVLICCRKTETAQSFTHAFESTITCVYITCSCYILDIMMLSLPVWAQKSLKVTSAITNDDVKNV